jgi:hypothetical protein
MTRMAPLGALSQAWVSAEASLPLGWRIVGLLRRERALRLLPSVRDEKLPEWCALAEDEARVLYDGWGGSHYQALNNLAIKLAKLRGSVSGE